jgi:hypothetical protein
MKSLGPQKCWHSQFQSNSPSDEPSEYCTTFPEYFLMNNLREPNWGWNTIGQCDQLDKPSSSGVLFKTAIAWSFPMEPSRPTSWWLEPVLKEVNNVSNHWNFRAFRLLLTSAWRWRSPNVEIILWRACDHPNLLLIINCMQYYLDLIRELLRLK